MKKTIFALSLLSIVTIGCTKTDTVSETPVIANEVVIDPTVAPDSSVVNDSEIENTDQADGSYTYTYKADDGQIAAVTFLNSNTEHTLTIIMNDKTYVLDQKEAWAKGADYERDGVKAHQQRDDLELTIEGKKTKLKRQYEK